jgi:hypothetical protein
MRPLLLATAALIGLAAAMSSSAHAECRWVQINGHQRELCDNAWDAPVLRPLPEMPLLPTLPPLSSIPPLPPLGARECHQAEVQFGSRSEWLEVCPTQDGRLLLPAH